MSKISGVHYLPTSGLQNFVSQDSMVATATTGTPAAGTFHSTIIGRLPMPDLSKDLKPRMGIERLMMNALIQSPGEYGPSGELVYKIPDDSLGLIRLVGGWTDNLVNMSNGRGAVVGPNANNASIEVTFYGTGLNLLYANSGTNDTVTIYVDGVAVQTAVNFPFGISSQSGVIFNRNHTANQVSNVVSGLSLGVHTVKHLITSSNSYFCGVEILNESSSVKTPPGNAYINGQKTSSLSLSALSYSAPVTGVKGGRVLVYQKSDGTIAQAFQAVDATQLNLTSTNHANEELVRAYHWREFGAQRSDDFSTLSGSTSTRAFTLDDDTTTLVGSNVETLASNTLDKLFFATSNTPITITFVGTGLDIDRIDNGATADPMVITVDGVNTGSVPQIGTAHLLKTIPIVSGLPYGTHVVKLHRNVAVSGSYALGGHFYVYQPKKPILPVGSIELADYNVMANFVANTTVGDPTFLSQGILRKHCLRELVYVVGGAYSVSAINSVGPVGGTYVTATSPTTSNYYQYTFFGTGFDLRTTNFAAGVTMNVTLNGLAATVANFPTLAAAAQGGSGAAYNTGTGLYSTGTNNNYAMSLQITALPLATYTVKFTYVSGVQFSVEALDIITPIHSHKANLFDVMSSSPVGSQSISDNRALSPVASALSSDKAFAFAVGIIATPTSTTLFPAPVPDLILTVNCTRDAVLLMSFYAYEANSGGGQQFFQFFVDGLPVGMSSSGETNVNRRVSLTAAQSVTKGFHTVAIYFWVLSGTAALNGTNRYMFVKEL